MPLRSVVVLPDIILLLTISCVWTDTCSNKYDLLREEKQEQEQLFTEQEKELEEKHASTLQQIETNFQDKTAIEVARYHKVVSEREKDKKEAETRLQQANDEFTSKLAKVTTELEEAERKAVEERDSLQQQKDLALKTHQELLRQIEEDADREIEELKEMYETKLAQEGAEKVRLRGQAGIHRKRHEDLKEQMELLREELKQKEEIAQRFRSEIEKLLSDREAVLRELQERDRTIGEKEQRIYELKKHNQELEKFKFVLDHKIRELKSTIDPKDKHIVEMQKQIQAMDAELVDYHRQHKLSTLEVAQLKLKQRALQDEIVEQRQKLVISAHHASRIKTDLYDCAQHLQDPKQLKESVTKLYQKYLIDNNNSNSPRSESRRNGHDGVDVDILKELHRQREYLEKSVESLKRRLAKDAEVHRQDNIKLMQENASLICEINDLRKEVNTLRLEKQEARMHDVLYAHLKRSPASRYGNKAQTKIRQQSGDMRSTDPGELAANGEEEAAAEAGTRGGSAGLELYNSTSATGTCNDIRKPSPPEKRGIDNNRTPEPTKQQVSPRQPRNSQQLAESFSVVSLTPIAQPFSTASYQSSAATMVRTPREMNKPSVPQTRRKSAQTGVEQTNPAESGTNGPGPGKVADKPGTEPLAESEAAAAAALSREGEEQLTWSNSTEKYPSAKDPCPPHLTLETKSFDGRHNQPEISRGEQPQANTSRSNPKSELEADRCGNAEDVRLTDGKAEQHNDASNFAEGEEERELSPKNEDTDKDLEREQ